MTEWYLVKQMHTNYHLELRRILNGTEVMCPSRDDKDYTILDLRKIGSLLDYTVDTPNISYIHTNHDGFVYHEVYKISCTDDNVIMSTGSKGLGFNKLSNGDNISMYISFSYWDFIIQLDYWRIIRA